MQGQRSAYDPFPEAVDLNQGPVSNNADMDHSTAWNNMLNPVESRLSNYALSSAERNFNYTNAVGHNARSLSAWDFGESSSTANLQDQVPGDGLKMEHDWSSSFSATRLEERRFEQSNSLLHDAAGRGLVGNQVTRGPLGMESSGPNHTPMSVNLNGDNIVTSNNIGSSSGNSGYFGENDGGSVSNLGSWGLSCKRKSLEGTSGQSFPGGSSSCFPQAEHIVPHNATRSLTISSPPMNSPNVGSFEQLNTRIGVGSRGDSDVFPPSFTGIAASPPRNFGVRINQGNQDPVLFNLPSTGNAIRRSSVRSPHQSSRPSSFTDSLDSRPRNMLPYPWNGPLNSRPGSSSSSLTLSGDRGSGLRDEANFRGTLRNNTDYPPMFVQDPTNWSLATGNSSASGGVPSSSRVAPSTNVRPFPNVWLPHHNPQTQSSQRSSEFAPWTLFPPVESEVGGQRGHFTPFASGSSTTPEETVMSSEANRRGSHQPYSRSTLFMEVPVDDVNGWRALAADIEGRQRLVSEIRQVLNAMRRGENLRAEDYMLFDPFINGVAELHDRHRDMRLDVDNMSYEELLALGERIGDVNTGLTEEIILQTMKQRKYLLFSIGPPSKIEPCCICQEEYVTGDDIGMLDCGHDFHTICIKQWLKQKNLCPICKMTGLGT